ncbi:MAG TPA: hypothetical protein VL346_12400 [Acidobacteriaceae bacterium]|nr:hypothetical protein [Acidobacteriaceae bacterium]
MSPSPVPPRSPRRLFVPAFARNPGAPMPLWMIFPVIFTALYLTHFTLLRLPYWWDETGYYIPAAWDFFRTGSLIPISTISNAHPPLPSIYLALWWKLCGFHPAVTREAVLIVAAAALLAVWRLVLRLSNNAVVAFWTVLLTGLYPIWFAQSTLAHADIFAAACTLWALVYVLPESARRPAATFTPNFAGKTETRSKNRIWPAAIWFSLAVLSKETAIVIPLSLAAFELGVSFLQPRALRLRAWTLAATESVCLLPLLAWYAYHRAKTGFLFGNPEFLRYNATSTMEPLRILAAFAHRLLHLFAHMNMFVPVLCTLAVLMLPPRTLASGKIPPAVSFPVRSRILFLIFINALEFSVLGGALLTRYLLPIFPLILFLCVSAFYRRSRRWLLFATLSAAAFVAALFINPPYGFAPEDNLTYAHVIRLHQQAIHELNLHDKGASVLSAWPGTDELSRPELGYAAAPPAPAFDVVRIDDFSAPQIDRAAAEAGSYSMAFVFSTKEEPTGMPFHIGGAAMEARYFGLHTDLRPDAIAQRLHGEIIWQRTDGLQWAALLRFRHPVEARLELH